jgi:type II secretory pathway component GspD/PulD (secretin)
MVRISLGTLAIALAFGATALAQTPITIDTTPNETAADLVTMIGSASGQNIVPGPSLSAIKVSLHLGNVSPDQALQVLESAYGLTDYVTSGVRIVVSRTDILSGPGSQTISLQTPPGFADTLATMAHTSLPNVSVTAIDNNSVVATGDVAGLNKLRALITVLAQNQVEQTVQLNYNAPDQMLAALKTRGLIGNTTFVSTNPNDESLTFAGPKSAVDSLVKETAILDRQPRRAVFVVQVLETQPIEDSSNRGIIWGQPQVGSNSSGSSTVSVLQGITTWVQGHIPIAAQINQLVSEGHAKVLARPSLAFNSNQPGTFNFTENYPIETQNGGLNGGSSVSFYPIGIILNVKGLIGTKGQITTSVSAIDSSIVSFDPLTHLPIVAQRGATSTVTVYPNESIVLAGFLDDEQSDTTSGVPFLMNIPIIGQLFKDRQTSHTRTELTFIITPQVVQETALQ